MSKPAIAGNTPARGPAASAVNTLCDHRPVISFIVPAHDEERLLGETLQALAAATRPIDVAHEIIVVDDASADRTAAIAAAHGACVVRVAHRHIAAARNAGVRVARGDVLVFVDADTCVATPVVMAALSAIREGAVGGALPSACNVRWPDSFASPKRLSCGASAS
jgi:glycosyltransferase involved in cell wall biosynthesis